MIRARYALLLIFAVNLLTACHNDTSSSSTSPTDPSANSVQSTCASGNGSLVVSNRAGEDVVISLTSGGLALPVINVASGASVTTPEVVGTLQISVSGVLTGNTILQQSPAILCDSVTSLTIAPETVNALAVSLIGSGQGFVSTSTGSIQCINGSTLDCAAPYLLNQTVTLTATPELGSQFSAWTGACVGSSQTCVVSMSQAQTVTAQFDPNSYLLKAVLNGNGQGTVSSSSGSINCSDATINASACTTTAGGGSTVSLTATASTGSQFAGWDVLCLGQLGNTCQVSIAQASTVSASFTLFPELLNLALSGTGTGVVTGGIPAIAGTAFPIYCSSPSDTLPTNQPKSCSYSANFGSAITLTARPDASMIFTAWSGACTGSNTTCTVLLSQLQSVTAQFDLAPYAFSLSLTGTGSGTVTSSPAGVACTTGSTANCGVNFPYNTSVILTAIPSPGITFTGWTSGPCSGSTATTCSFKMTAALSAKAQFDQMESLNISLVGTNYYQGAPIPASYGTVSVRNFSNASTLTCDSSGAGCSATYVTGTNVLLTANPISSQQFVGWTGCPQPGGNTCIATMSQAVNVIANFGNSATAYVATNDPSGSNTVLIKQSNYPGYSYVCSGTGGCPNYGPIGMTVTLVAQVDTAAYQFTGWNGGPCSGSMSTTCSFVAGSGSSYSEATFVPALTNY